MLPTVTNIAIVYHTLGQPGAALEWYVRSFALHERKFGNDHRFTLCLESTIGAILHALGQHIQALKWYKKSLASHERKFGNDHEVSISIEASLLSG